MSDEKVTGEKWLDVSSCGWLVRYSHTTHWLDFEAFEVVAVEDDGTKCFSEKGHPGGSFVSDPDKAEVSVSGFVKWDGCFEIRLAEATHFCGAKHVAVFAKVVVELHRLCLLIPKVNRAYAGYAPDRTHEIGGFCSMCGLGLELHHKDLDDKYGLLYRCPSKGAP